MSSSIASQDVGRREPLAIGTGSTLGSRSVGATQGPVPSRPQDARGKGAWDYGLEGSQPERVTLGLGRGTSKGKKVGAVEFAEQQARCGEMAQGLGRGLSQQLRGVREGESRLHARRDLAMLREEVRPKPRVLSRCSTLLAPLFPLGDLAPGAQLHADKIRVLPVLCKVSSDYRHPIQRLEKKSKVPGEDARCSE